MGSVVVSGDARDSTPLLKKALCEGLNEMGVDTVDIGMGPTPLLYFTLANSKKFDLGIAVTASHNPPEFNGFKICDSKGVSLSYENFFYKLENWIDEEKEFFLNLKKESGNEGMGGHTKNEMLQDAYYSFLKDVAKEIGALKLVIEYGNGCTGRFAEVVPSDAIHLHRDPRGDFPILNPDPTKEKSYRYVKEKIKNREAEVGIVFDGDGDRVGFMGPDCSVISPDVVMMMFFDELKEKKANPSVVVDVKISKATAEYIVQNGGSCKLSKVGHSYIQEMVLSESIDVAGELSCHYYFNDEYFGFDDGLYSAIRFLRILSKANQNGNSLRSIVSKYPKYHSSPEFRIHLPRERHQLIFTELKKFAETKNATILEIDGIRAEFPDGWFLVRSSNTEAKLSYRIEASSEQHLNELQKEVEKIIAQHST